MTRKKLFIFCSLLTTALHTTFGMENISNHEIVTSVASPTFIAFLQDNTLAIAGKNNFSIIDLKTKSTLIEQQSTATILDIAINYKKTKIALSTSKRDKYIIYNTQTKQLESLPINPQDQNCDDHLTHAPITFNSENDNEVILYTFRNNMFHFSSPELYHTRPAIQEENKPYNDYIVNAPIICHPNELKIIYPISRNEIGEYTKTHLAFCPHSPGNNLIGYEYSPNGNHLIFIKRNYGWGNRGTYRRKKETNYFDEQSNYIVDTDKSVQRKAHYISVSFHPNNITIALLAHNNTLEYWNYETKQLIKTIKLNLLDELEETNKLEKRLSFSPDGMKILVALKNKCFVLPVPTEVLYLPKNLEILLNACNHLAQHGLPTEIIQFILNIMKNILPSIH